MPSNGPRNLQIALAFDHELSLGGTPDYDRNLFAPTRALLDLADEIGVKVTLFTDVLSAIAHERWEVPAFVEPYRASLIDAIRRGHDVQLHLHPHWLTSRWEGGRFVPSRDFALADFADGSRGIEIEGIVELGVRYLRALGSSADPSYRCIAFRAGGYNIAPHTARIMRALHDNGIRIDSSIIKGYRFRSGLSSIDFRAMPTAANWQMHGLYEVPIASAPRTPLNNLPFLYRRLVHRGRRHTDGGFGIHDGNTSLAEKLGRLLPFSAWPLCFDHFSDSADDVFAVLRRHVDAHRRDERIACASVAHPKSMGPHERSVVRGFVERARRTYGPACSFVTFRTLEEIQPWSSISPPPQNRPQPV
jgi:hypothetical protein